MPLPDVLQFVGLGRKTGVLTVRTGTTRKEVTFRDGRAVFCSTNNPKEYLGAQLLARTALTEQDLEQAFREQDRSGRPLGEILVSRGHLTAEELRTVLEQKVMDSLFELFEWTAGRFEFAEREVVDSTVPFYLDVGMQDLVMEGARRADEMARVRLVIPASHARFRTVRAKFPGWFPRSNGDKKLVDLVEQGLSVAEICPRFHASDFDIQSRLAALVRHGMLDVDSSAPARDGRNERSSLLNEARELADGGRFRAALDLLRDAAHRWFDDADVLEALHATERMVRQRVGDATADLSAVPTLTTSLEQLMHVGLTSKQAFVVTRINGQWSVRSLVQICPFDEADVLAILDELARDGRLALQVPLSAKA